MAEQVILRVQDHTGYAPDQITESVTLGALAAALEEAIEEFGENAMIVLSNGERYGASYGQLSQWDDLFVPVDDEED